MVLQAFPGLYPGPQKGGMGGCEIQDSKDSIPSPLDDCRGSDLKSLHGLSAP